MSTKAEKDLSPFTDREQIFRSLQTALGITFGESDLSETTLEKIGSLVSLKQEQRTKHAESWAYFRKVQRYWILFFGLLILGVVLVPFFLIGIAIIAPDAFLYRWIRKRERTTPQASLEAIELSKNYVRDLEDIFNDVRLELSKRKPEESMGRGPSANYSDFIGRAVWVEMDVDHSATRFSPRKGIVVKIFANPPSNPAASQRESCNEALIVELANPPLTLFPVPRRIRFLITEYYQKWDSIHHTFDSGHSFVRFLRLKNRSVMEAQTYTRRDASAIGYGDLSMWPVPSTNEFLLKKMQETKEIG